MRPTGRRSSFLGHYSIGKSGVVRLILAGDVPRVEPLFSIVNVKDELAHAHDFGKCQTPRLGTGVDECLICQTEALPIGTYRVAHETPTGYELRVNGVDVSGGATTPANLDRDATVRLRLEYRRAKQGGE